MQIYKANLKNELVFTAGVLVFLTLLISLFSKVATNGWITVLLLLVSILVYNLLCSRLTEIHVDETNMDLILIYKNHFKIIKSIQYTLNDINFTYKRKATSFRGGIKNVCTLYLRDKILAEVIPDNDGWDDSEADAFVSKLRDLGIERKFVGYALKDVEI